jgi:DNA invertase Pin-like site-specific DNA recombinase
MPVQRVALYTRVSTTDKGQTVENQVLALRQACAGRNWSIVLEEQDAISGTKRVRPGLDRLFAAAGRGEFDTVVVWSLDRLTREGALRALEIIQQLGQMGVGFHSLQEPHFDTCGPFKDAIIAIAATLAKLEREKIVERIHAGLARTRAQGTRLGRPPICAGIAPRVLELHAANRSLAGIASSIRLETRDGKPCGPSKSTIRRILKQHRRAETA